MAFKLKLPIPAAVLAARQRLNDWLGRSIVNRAAFAGALFVLCSTGFLALASLPIIYLQVADTIAIDKEHQAARLQEYFEYRLGAITESVQGLARNSFVVNAFVDSAGRETYLQPLLRDYQPPFAVNGRIVVLDMNLQPVAANFYDQLAGYAGLAVARAALQGKKAALDLGRDDRSLLLATPVFFPPAAANVGVVLLEIPLEPLLLVSPKLVDASDCYAVALAARPIYRSPCAQASPGEETGAWRPLELGLAGKPMTLAFEDHDKSVAYSLTTILLVYLALAVAAGLLARFVTRRQIGQLTQPLVELSDIAQAIADDPKSAALAPVAGDDEVSRLARAFNAMIEEMRGLHGDLEARVQARTRELSESGRILRTAIDALDEAFVLFDPQDRLVFCNDKYRALYATSADLLVPGASFEQLIRAGAMRGQYREAIGRVEEWVAERMAMHREGNLTLEQHLDSGRWVRILERRTDDGYFVGFRIDITALKLATENALAASESKSRFLATMSHEIRTPMNGILGMTQLLLRAQLGQGEREDCLRTILSSGKTLLALLNDILDLSKVEAGKIELESIAFEPGQLVHEIETLFADAAASKGLQLHAVWHAGGGQRYRGDPLRLRQMLHNLVSNAIKFTAVGQVRLEAREIDRDDSFALLEFAVTDTGIGIAADKLTQLFEPFTQADSSTTRQYGGTGLGLSIVRNLARLMGGEAGADSGPGSGSRFWFRIRVGVLAAQEERGESETMHWPADAPGNALAPLSGRVLVVEDNATNRKVVATMLGKLGMRVALAEDGRAAVELLTGRERPDLVLMDVQMPVMDGCTATEAVRQWEAAQGSARLPIVALTAGAFMEDRRQCLASGMDDFLAKPVDIDELHATLARWLSPGPTPGAAPEAAAEAATFDAELMLTRLGGDRELARVIVRSAEEDLPGYFAALDSAVAAANWQDAQRATHTMKGLAAQIGGTRLAQELREAEARLKGGDRLGAAEISALRQEYALLTRALQAWMQ